MFGRTELNFNASKNKVTITTFPRTEKKKLQRLKEKGKNTSVW